MVTTQERERREDLEQQEREALGALLGEQVLHALGEPGGLRRVQVRPLWQGHYRANVFVGGDAASAKVAHSFFLVADDDGNIVTSTPEIARQY